MHDSSTPVDFEQKWWFNDGWGGWWNPPVVYGTRDDVEAGPYTHLLRVTANLGRIQGTVEAAGGGAIVGATVTLLRDNHSVVTVTTGEGGYYFMGSIQPGTYKIKAEAPMFQPKTEDVTVAKGQAAVVNFQLQPMGPGGGG